MRKNLKISTHVISTENVKLNVNQRSSIEGYTTYEKTYSMYEGLSPTRRLTPLDFEKNEESSNIDFPFKNSNEEFNHHKKKEKCVFKVKYSQPKDIAEGVESKKLTAIELAEQRLKLSQMKKINPQPLPKRPLILSLSLFIIGLLLLIFGTYSAFKSQGRIHYLPFLIVGGVCGLPGSFYTFKILKVFCAKSEEAQQKALDELPQQ